MDLGVISLGLVALIVLTVALARSRMHGEHETRRGSEPGTGDHVIDISYNSGGPGGGHQGELRVPRDPQEYARRFVPQSAWRRDAGSGTVPPPAPGKPKTGA
jgi:hypothetical protein